MSEEEQTERRNKYLEDANEIYDAAIGTILPNCVSKELTYQQALSILLRSRQLAREGKMHPSKIHPKMRDTQIDKCYAQRERRRRR